jgi:ubiquinone/menaquinone biosynthesis C-methylase UbiE
MKRIPEPELMENRDQVIAYAKADFEVPHSHFIERLKVALGNHDFDGVALDLGCGPGDICRRFAEAYPRSRTHAVDGAKAMIDVGEESLSPFLQKRIHFILGRLPNVVLPNPYYDIIYSNSLLHHLHDPLTMWQVIKHYSRPNTRIVIMDLLRPDSIESAQIMVDTYAGNEPQILQQDFYNSLLAAFSLEEIRQQIKDAGLPLDIEQISNRHVFISGVIA